LFYVFALVDKERHEAVAEVVKAESLPEFKPDADLNRGGAAIMLALRSVLPFIFVEGKSSRPASHRAYKQRPGNSVPLSVPLKLRLTRISACLGGPRRCSIIFRETCPAMLNTAASGAPPSSSSVMH
jgi:hypothetical protein